jgi:hypothetical protein
MEMKDIEFENVYNNVNDSRPDWMKVFKIKRHLIWPSAVLRFELPHSDDGNSLII